MRAFRLWRGPCQLIVGHTTASSSLLNAHLQGSAPSLASLPWQTWERIILRIPFRGSCHRPVSTKTAGFCSLLRTIMVACWSGVAYAIQAQDSIGYQIHRINLHMDIFIYERGVILWNWNSFPQAQVKLRESKILRSLCVIQSCYQF